MRSADARRRQRAEHHTGRRPGPLSGTSKDVPQRGHTRSETVLASKTTASTPTITPLQENVWTKCYQYETLVQEV